MAENLAAPGKARELIRSETPYPNQKSWRIDCQELLGTRNHIQGDQALSFYCEDWGGGVLRIAARRSERPQRNSRKHVLFLSGTLKTKKCGRGLAAEPQAAEQLEANVCRTWPEHNLPQEVHGGYTGETRPVIPFKSRRKNGGGGGSRKPVGGYSIVSY